jgi:copper chaperone CopZ
METRLNIQGMSCGHCAGAVRDALARVPGVDRVVDVDLERGRATVTGNPNADQLIAAVAAAGFTAKLD